MLESMDNIMDCKETQRLIRMFLKNELKDQERYAFIQHIRSCKECMDELSLSFIVTEGVNMLDEDASIDLNAELNRLLDIGEYRSHFHLRKSLVAIAAMIACVLLLVGSAGLM